MSKNPKKALQITLRNDLVMVNQKIDSLATWMAAYLQYEVTTRETTRKVQRRDLLTFLNVMVQEAGNDNLQNWSPRLSQTFKGWLQKEVNVDNTRRWNDRTVNRILAHLKTFARWVHKYRPFPLGNPMEKIKLISTASLLAIDRAITAGERRRLLDAADLLVETGGRSKDRHRYRDATKRPRRKDYRPYRNRAITYALIETGMRRAAVVSINVDDVDSAKRTIRTEEKGGKPAISRLKEQNWIALPAVLNQLENYAEYEIGGRRVNEDGYIRILARPAYIGRKFRGTMVNYFEIFKGLEIRKDGLVIATLPNYQWYRRLYGWVYDTPLPKKFVLQHGQQLQESPRIAVA